MSRHKPTPLRTLFQGNEFMRLATMIVMLVVLFMLIRRSQDANTWTWLAADTSASSQDSQPPAENKSEDKHKSRPAGTEKSVDKTTAPGGPTDEDPEEKEAAAEQFQAISDGTAHIQPEEMPAYNRLLKWVQNQSLAQMRRRAKKDVAFTQFYQQPDKYRGKLCELELNVRRILKETHNNLTLYEIWGWTAESRSGLYVGVVIDLPKGMPSGPDVYEKAVLVGYFFKLQGYQPADAKPNAAPLKAPLLIGRLLWRPTEKPQVQRSDWYWGLFLLLGFLAFIIIRWSLLLWKPRRKYTTSSVLTKRGGLSVQEWLAEAETDELPEGGVSEEDTDSPDEASDSPL
jgi:hypothetical protein